jgi:hypothetical protein
MSDPINCERCDSLVANAIDIPAVGEHRGATVYRCAGCDHITWRWIEPAKRRSVADGAPQGFSNS